MSVFERRSLGGGDDSMSESAIGAMVVDRARNVEVWR
jgi:hypothetical protein